MNFVENRIHSFPECLPLILFSGRQMLYRVRITDARKIRFRSPGNDLGDQQDSIAELKGFKNIHLLGKKPYSEIPAYGAFFDVALLPYRDNEWIRYCNPIKMKEYLALGLMIVSSEYPEAHNYAGRIQIAANGDEMVQKIRDYLAHPIGPEERQRLRASVVDETWDARTKRLADYVDGLIGDRA